MTVKAGTGTSIAAALIGYGTGAALGLFFTRAPVAEAEAVTSPSS
jgi:hypothetical protein